MKKSVIRIAVVLFALIAAFIFVRGIYDKRAAFRADAICSAIKPGMNEAQVISMVYEKQGWYRKFDVNIGKAGATGWEYTCSCDVMYQGNKVDGTSKPQCVD